MSLLLDALRRAEQEKLAKQAQPPAPGRARAPASPPAQTPSLELQPIGSGAAAASAAHAPPMPGRSEAESAQTVFKAKAAAPAEPTRKSGALWAVVGAIVVVVAAVGAYVWYSVQSLTPRTVVRTRPASAPVAPLPPIEAVAPARPALPAPAPAQAPAVVSVAPQPAPQARPVPPAREDAEQRVLNLLRDAGPAKPAPLRLTQANQAPRVPTEVAAGYAALRSGNLQAARRSYAAALASDPASLDAQLGLATVEAHSGNRAAAAEHYRRALDIDPRNATAIAGLASITDYSQPGRLEGQLRADLARQPGSAALRFTLGNLYASQSRWHEAQVEYFEAHRLEPASADIVFNLAVSLDHLGQSRLAADYYRRALAAALGQAVQFDPAPVERRLAELGFESPVR